MFEANRQVQIHHFKASCSKLSRPTPNKSVRSPISSAPSLIATKAGAFHLVDPTSVTQIPSTSLDAPLPLPKFSGYAPATSRTIR